MNDLHRRRLTGRARKGQATVELLIVFIVLMIIVFAVIDFGRLISLSNRMSSVAREGGRTAIAKGYDLRPTTAPDEVYDALKEMIQPGDLDGKGKVIFTILRREDPDDDTSYDDPDTEDDDRIYIEAQHIYPTSSTLPSLDSTIGVVGDTVATQADSSFLSLDMLRIDERTIAVEIYHEAETLTPIGNIIEASMPEYLYDSSIF